VDSALIIVGTEEHFENQNVRAEIGHTTSRAGGDLILTFSIPSITEEREVHFL
jgi:hypothetical protein